MSQLVVPILEPSQLANIGALMLAIVDDSVQFRIQWLEERKWAVVSIDRASHIDQATAEQLADALSHLERPWCFAIATEPVGDDPEAYRVSTSQEGLREFSWRRRSFNFLLITEDASIAVLISVEDYDLVGGIREFVVRAVGGNIEKARSGLRKFATENWEIGSTRKVLTTVADRYDRFNG